jgi:hypothetical protein
MAKLRRFINYAMVQFACRKQYQYPYHFHGKFEVVPDHDTGRVRPRTGIHLLLESMGFGCILPVPGRPLEMKSLKNTRQLDNVPNVAHWRS